MKDRIQRWTTRQQVLSDLLREHGAERHDWRVDLAEGRFWWQHPETGAPSIVAEAKVLGSWALSNASLLAGWANRSLPESAVVEPVTGVPERHVTSEPADVWDWAIRIAEGARAHFVYRAPNPQSWVFLGLWNVRPAGEGDAAFRPTPPWHHVNLVLGEILSAPERDARVLVRNYGRAFVEDPTAVGTAWRALLGGVGERMIALAGADLPDLRAGVAALLAETRTYVA